MADASFISMGLNQQDINDAAKEARRKKIKELESSLFQNADSDDLLWNPRYIIVSKAIFL
jgi:hypothetical protein